MVKSDQEKLMIRKIKNVTELLQFLKDYNEDFITDKGKGFLESMILFDNYPEVVSKKRYDELANRSWWKRLFK